tara:strand:+ start:1848 stop:2426 length:579 start_codon:yes stop_codon:yes gene_type:complete
MAYAQAQEILERHDQTNSGFYGESERRDKDMLKRLGARWGVEKRQWYAPTTRVLVKLVESRKWKYGPNGAVTGQMLLRVLQDIDNQASSDREKRQRDEEEARAQKTAQKKRAKEAASNLVIRRELGVYDDTESDMEDLEKLCAGVGKAITKEMVQRSVLCPELGPRSGMSDARRFRRAFSLKLDIPWHKIEQ